MVKYGDTTDIKTIVDVVTANLCPHSSQERAYSKCYAIRLNHLHRQESCAKQYYYVVKISNERAHKSNILTVSETCHWLTPDLTMTQVRDRYEKRHPHNEWQYELRVRYVPRDMKELLEKDRVTFYYFYDQVRAYDLVVSQARPAYLMGNCSGSPPRGASHS